MGKGVNILAGVSLIIALAGIAVGVFSFISMNNYITKEDAYVLPMARVYYGGPYYTIPSGGAPILFNFTHKNYDTHERFDLDTDSYSIPETGYYQIIAQYSIDADAGEFFRIELYSNNVLVCSKAYTTGYHTNHLGVSLMDIRHFTEEDSLTIKAYQYNAGDLPRAIFSGEADTYFAIAKMA